MMDFNSEDDLQLYKETLEIINQNYYNPNKLADVVFSKIKAIMLKQDANEQFFDGGEEVSKMAAALLLCSVSHDKEAADTAKIGLKIYDQYKKQKARKESHK